MIESLRVLICAASMLGLWLSMCQILINALQLQTNHRAIYIMIKFMYIEMVDDMVIQTPNDIDIY